MKFVILMFCLLGAVYANPLLHKMAMEMIQHASNSSESSSISESSEQSKTSEPSDENSKDNTSESNTSESLESDSAEPRSKESQSYSVESLIGKSETAMTSDNTQGSKENIRRGWIYTLKWVHANYSQVQATSEPDEDDITDEVKSIDITDESTGATSKPSESSESSESREHFRLSSNGTRDDDSGADTSESAEHSYAVDGTEFSASNSSSSSSSESTESSNSEMDDHSRSVECIPGADSRGCDSKEHFPQDIGDDGATDPFNGFLMPDDTEP